MGFWDITWRYLVGLSPLYAAYMIGLRFRFAGPRLLRLFFSVANVGLLGYLVYLSVSSGGVGLLAAVANVFGAMVTVLGLAYVVVLMAARRLAR